MIRRNFLSLASLLVPGAFDRISAQTIATAVEPEPEPVTRVTTFRLEERFVRMEWVEGEVPVITQLQRPTFLGHLPQPEPTGHILCRHPLPDTLHKWAGTLFWPDNPRESCARCLWECAAWFDREVGEWRCHVGGNVDQYQGPRPYPEDPGFRGYY